MSKRLKKYKRDKMAIDLIKNDFNCTKTYAKYYPNQSYGSVKSNASGYMTKYGIVEKAIEILEKKGMDLDTILSSFKDQLAATKGIIVNHSLKEIPDHNVRLEAKKFLLTKVYQLGDKENVLDGRPSVNININAQDSKVLERIVNDLDALNKSLGFQQSGEIIEAENIESRDGG